MPTDRDGPVIANRDIQDIENELLGVVDEFGDSNVSAMARNLVSMMIARIREDERAKARVHFNPLPDNSAPHRSVEWSKKTRLMGGDLSVWFAIQCAASEAYKEAVERGTRDALRVPCRGCGTHLNGAIFLSSDCELCDGAGTLDARYAAVLEVRHSDNIIEAAREKWGSKP